MNQQYESHVTEILFLTWLLIFVIQLEYFFDNEEWMDVGMRP